YPLVNTDVFILPSTLYRRTVLYAQVQLEDQNVDFYCGFLQTTGNSDVFPYQGNYGNGPITEPDGGLSTSDAWANEQIWEAQQLVQWVQQKSGSTSPPTPAIVVGDWHASVATNSQLPPNTFNAIDVNPYTVSNVFAAAQGWSSVLATSATGSKWLPQCNVCPPPENPYNDTSYQFFELQPFLAYWPQANATQDESLEFTEGVIDIAADAGGQGPASPYYGLNFTLTRPH
ncbi:MAG TPA: hypothetical protein VIY73_04310, partial [Polyangiaceae bacterium]